MTTTPYLDELAELTAETMRIHTNVVLAREQHADTRRALRQAEKDIADGGGDDAADRLVRLRAQVRDGDRPGREIDVVAERRERELSAAEKRAQRQEDDYRRVHAADLAAELMPQALAARDELLEAFASLESVVQRWNRTAGAFRPMIVARDDLRLNDVPDNPLGNAVGNMRSSLDRLGVHKLIPAPWQALPDGEMQWPKTEQGTVHTGQYHRNASRLREDRERFADHNTMEVTG